MSKTVSKRRNTPSIKVGDIFKTNQGYECKVIEYVNARNVTVEFLDDTKYIRTTTTSHLQAGKCRNPLVMKVPKDMTTGSEFDGKDGSRCKVILYRGEHDVLIEFIDEHKYQVSVTARRLRLGSLRNPFRPSAHGVGYMGIGEFSSKLDGKDTLAYSRWSGILQRVYSEKFLDENPTYRGCKVVDEWHNFQVFAKWFTSQKFYGAKGYDIDKDILDPSSKTYGPDTCRLVPNAINKLLLDSKTRRGDLPKGLTATPYNRYAVQLGKKGVATYIGTTDSISEGVEMYKAAKTKHVREMALEYKDQIDEDIFEVLINWVE